MSIHRRKHGLFEASLVREALGQSFIKLNPGKQFRNPVMFAVWIGTVVMAGVCVWIAAGETSQGSLVYNIIITAILFLTLLFANFAEAIAEARGKAQADSLRKTREDTPAKKIFAVGEMFVGEVKVVPSSQLRKGDLFFCEAGDIIPMDGEIVEGIATIDESALTILLAAFTLIFIIVCVTLKPFGDYSNTFIPIAAFVSLYVCLIPTTIGGLLSAIGIAGMDRALRANVITKSGKAVETAGDVDVLLLDKTGTITIGNRKATNFYSVDGITENEFIRLSALSSLSDDTPEGKSIVELALQKGVTAKAETGSQFIKFTAETRSSGVDTSSGIKIRKGAFDAIRDIVTKNGNRVPAVTSAKVKSIAANGGTPLVVSVNNEVK